LSHAKTEKIPQPHVRFPDGVEDIAEPPAGQRGLSDPAEKDGMAAGLEEIEDPFPGGLALRAGGRRTKSGESFLQGCDDLLRDGMLYCPVRRDTPMERGRNLPRS
jgi:hypothetical protein